MSMASPPSNFFFGAMPVRGPAFRIAVVWSLLWLAGPALSAAPVTGQLPPEYPQMGPDIFDRSANAEKLIATALSQVNAQHQRVVLLLGANWCPWCRRLHAVISTDAAVAKTLRDTFVLAFVDVNQRNDRHRNATTLKKYGEPVKKFGLPVLLVLDSNGDLLAVQETESFAVPTDKLLAEKLLDWLQTWRGPN
jgi:thiol:disulfide interchange protein